MINLRMDIDPGITYFADPRTVDGLSKIHKGDKIIIKYKFSDDWRLREIVSIKKQ